MRAGGFTITIAASALLIAPERSAGTQSEPLQQAQERGVTKALHRRTAATRARRAHFEALVNEAARRHGVRAELLHAIIEVESSYDPTAVSPAGAVGLMQLMPSTAARNGVADPTDPGQTVAGGAAYLRDLHAQFGHDLRLILAAYNAGEDAVERFGRKVSRPTQRLRSMSGRSWISSSTEAGC